MPPRTVVDHEIELGQLRFHYRDWPGPTASAPALVLLHGATNHARSMDGLARAMTDRYRVVVPDQRGHGETEWAAPERTAPERYHQQVLADDLEALIAALSLERFALVGYSMGGMAAYAFAGRRPRGLTRLVIVDIGVSSTPSMDQLKGWFMKRAAMSYETVDEAVASGLQLMPNADRAELTDRLSYSLVQADDGRWRYRYDPAVLDLGWNATSENWRLLSQVEVPTLLIRGGASEHLPAEMARRMVEVIPQCELVVFDGATHGLPIEAPVRFIETVSAFL